MSSAVNSSSTPLGSNQEFQGTYEFLSADRHGVQVACSTDAAGILVIEFSQNKSDIIYTHNFPIEVDVSFSRAVSKKANYYRVRLVNGVAVQTTLQLASIIQTTYQPDVLDIELDSATSSVTVFGTDSTGTLRAVKTLADGSLVVSGGGSSGGDASSTNQLTQIDVATNSNLAVCTRLTSIDTSSNNIEVILDNYRFTTSNLHVRDDLTLLQLQNSNVAQFGKLNLIEQSGEISSGYLQTIDFKLTPLQQGIARYTLDAKTTLAPDTVPSYSAPPSGVAASEGWYYKNLVLGNTSQLYYYGNQATQTKNFDYEIVAIESQWACVRLLNLNSAVGIPFLVVYSQPQGAGDHIPGFARSVWTYQIDPSAKLRLGEKVVLFRGTEPDLRVFPDMRRIECVLTTTSGPGLTSEKLAYATVNTDSGAAVGNAEYIISGAGITFNGDSVYTVELTGETTAISASDATAANQVLQLNAATNSNLALYTQLTTIKEVLENQINVVNYGLFDNTPTYVPMSVNAGGELLTFDSRSNASIYQCLSQLETVNASLDAVQDGSSQFYVKIDGADDAIQIWGYNPVDAMPEALYTTDHAVQAYITNSSVDVTGTVSLAEGAQVNLVNSTVGLIENTVVAITGDVAVTGTFWPETQVISGSVGLIESTVVGIAGDSVIGITGDVSVISGATALSVTETTPITSVFAKLQDGSENDISSTASEANGNVLNTRIFAYDLANDVTREVRMGENRGLFIENINSVDFEVVAKNDVKIVNADGTSLDVHCFGSSDGTTFHHLKTTATGELVTHSQTRDGSGTAITSTPNGGITALDVAISGTPVISGEVSTKAQVAYAPQVLASGTVVGPAQIGTTADSQGFLWVSALLTFTSVTTGGQIYIEISPDSSNWARPSAGSVFVMSSVSNVSASILLGIPVAMRYVRLYADSPFSGSGCNAFFSMK